MKRIFCRTYRPKRNTKTYKNYLQTCLVHQKSIVHSYMNEQCILICQTIPMPLCNSPRSRSFTATIKHILLVFIREVPK